MVWVNWKHWLRAIRSRALDVILLFVAWLLCAGMAFVVFDRPIQNKLARVQQVNAADPEITIVSRAQSSINGSRMDQRRVLAKIIGRIGEENPRAIIVLEELDQEIEPEADQELAQSIAVLGEKVILFAGTTLDFSDGYVPINLPLTQFREVARLGHNLQGVGQARHASRISFSLERQDGGTVRHIAVEAIDPSLSPERTYQFGLYRLWNAFTGQDDNARFFTTSVDERVTELRVNRVDEDELLSPDWDASLDERAIVVIEPIRIHKPTMFNESFVPSKLAEQTALQLYSLKNGTRNSIMDEDIGVLAVIICSVIYFLRRGVFGFGFALALSVAWTIAAYFLIPYMIYFSIFGPIAIFFTFAGVSARRQAEKRGIALAENRHPVSHLPNSVAFREASIGRGELVFAINSDRIASPKFKPAHLFKQAFGERLPKAVFQTSDTTLTALTDHATALELIGKMNASDWHDKALRAIAFKPGASRGLDTVVADLEGYFAELRSEGVPFKFIGNGAQEMDTQQGGHAQQLFREVLVYDMEARTPVGAMIEIPNSVGALSQVRQLIEGNVKKQERQAVHGRSNRGLWLSVDRSLLRDPAAIDYLASTLIPNSKSPLVSCVILRGFSHSQATGLELESVRRLARSGIEIGSEGMGQKAQSYADLVSASAQVMSIDLKGLEPVEETGSMLRAAKLFCDELARELYAENVGDAALAKMVSDAQIKYASGPAIAEFILGNDRAASDDRDVV